MAIANISNHISPIQANCGFSYRLLLLIPVSTNLLCVYWNRTHPWRPRSNLTSFDLPLGLYSEDRSQRIWLKHRTKYLCHFPKMKSSWVDLVSYADVKININQNPIPSIFFSDLGFETMNERTETYPFTPYNYSTLGLTSWNTFLFLWEKTFFFSFEKYSFWLQFKNNNQVIGHQKVSLWL